MCLTEFNEKVFAKGMCEEGMLIGVAKGKAESIVEFLEDYGNLSEIQTWAEPENLALPICNHS